MTQGSRPAVQQRSRETRDRIIDGLDRLLRTRDFGDISITDLAAEADVSPGAIYRRFDGGLLSVLFELHAVTLDRRIVSPDARIDVATGDLRPVLHAAARAVLAQLNENAHVYRAVYLYARLRPDVPGPARQPYESLALEGIRELLQAFRTRIKRTDINRTAATLAYFFNAIFLERFLFPGRSPDWPGLVAEDAFAAEMADMAYAYLTAPDL